MAKQRLRPQQQDPLVAIPNYVKTPHGVFEDIEHYRTVAERVTKALATHRLSRGQRVSSGSSLYESLHIEFSTQYKDEEIYLDAFTSRIILRAPKKKGESTESLQLRRMHYFEQLLRPIESMKTIGIAQIYLSLKDEGRRKISRKSTRREA